MLWLTNSTVRPSPRHFTHFAEALFLKFSVAYCQDLVDYENFRFEMSRDRECKANIHSRGIMLHRRIKKFFHFGERDDLIELFPNFACVIPRMAPLRKMFSLPVSSG